MPSSRLCLLNWNHERIISDSSPFSIDPQMAGPRLLNRIAISVEPTRVRRFLRTMRVHVCVCAVHPHHPANEFNLSSRGFNTPRWAGGRSLRWCLSSFTVGVGASLLERFVRMHLQFWMILHYLPLSITCAPRGMESRFHDDVSDVVYALVTCTHFIRKDSSVTTKTINISRKSIYLNNLRFKHTYRYDSPAHIRIL